MNFEKFVKCSQEHKESYEFCCMRENKIFCSECWYRQHALRCPSSRCGHYEKLAHLVIDKVLEMKTLYYTSEMSSAFDKYKGFKNSILKLKDFFIDNFKKEIQMKIPLFFNTMITEMLDSKMKEVSNISFEQEICASMLNVIKGSGKGKSSNLLSCLKNYDHITQEYSKFERKMQNKEFKGTKNDEALKSIQFFKSSLGQMYKNLKNSFKQNLEKQVKESLQKFDPTINFDGVRLRMKPTFQSLQCYSDKNILNQLFFELESEQTKLYNGYDISAKKIEQSPEAVLQVSKCFLKQKIFEIHNNIKEFKSTYPYKYGYIIATTLEPDEDYELTVINMEKKIIKNMEKKSDRPFLNSINIVIMGPECIIIQFKKRVQIQCIIKIYGYTPKREETIEKIINSLDIRDSKIDIEKKKTEIPYEKPQTSLSKAYINLQLAYEHLFLEDQNGFEGEKYVEVRGTKLYASITKDWSQKTGSEVSFKVQKSEQDLKLLFI